MQVNGAHENGSSAASTSNLAKAASATNAFDDRVYDTETANYLFNTGFLEAQFVDCSLDVITKHDRRVYRLHQIILARSPVLKQCILEQGSNLVLQVSDPNVDQVAICTAIGFLYSSQTRQSITHDSARSIYAAALTLSIQALADLALEVCRSAIDTLSDPAQIADWFQFIQTPYASSSLPSTPTTTASGSHQQYGKTAVALRDQLMHHICNTLPIQLSAFASSTLPPNQSNQPNLNAQQHQNNGVASSAGQLQLIQIYALLPFPLFKSIMESPDFPPGDMERFAFAKRCIQERKRIQGKDALHTEAAVLAFGSSGNGHSNVEIVGKAKKGAPKLWKVGDA